MDKEPWDYILRKYLLLLATLVATVTYSAGFNPPGGVWQETDAAAGHIAGDPIIRDTHGTRYAVFYYFNAAAFGSSLVVVVLILLLALLHEKKKSQWTIKMMPLRVVMVLDLLSLMAAYAAGTCRDTLTKVYSSVLVSAVVAYLIFQMARQQGAPSSPEQGASDKERQRKVLMLLATFAVSVTYVAGLSTPGGFWDKNEGGHRAGDAILKDHHEARLKAFFICNTTAFVASLLIIVVLLDRKLRLRESMVGAWRLYVCIVVALIGLVGAYGAGSSREIVTTYVIYLVPSVLVCMVLLANLAICVQRKCRSKQQSQAPRANNGREDQGQISVEEANNDSSSLSREDIRRRWTWVLEAVLSPEAIQQANNDRVDKARSLVLLLATLAATITYQAGLDPPGGLWQDNGPGYMAGDPILLTTNPRRYQTFFYCNSVALVASLVAIVLIQQKLLLAHHVLEAAMILDLFGLIGAYAAGTCRDVSSSIYVMALAGAVLVYVVIHVIFFTLDHEDNSMTDGEGLLLEKRRKRLLLFAILGATITYQAGLTPPSGFLLGDSSGHHAGDPVLLSNYPRRYMAFFYCNSVSFMLSIALIMLLVNPNLYRPAIRSNALSVCTAAGLFGLMGAYAAGSTQHLRTSISIIALVAVVSLFLLLFFVMYLVKDQGKGNSATTRVADAGSNPAAAAAAAAAAASNPDEKKRHAKRKYLMLLGILVASVTYQAGLDPPGGVWQLTGRGHDAGDPVMLDIRGSRYHAFFYCNSTSFMASIVVIILLLPHGLTKDWWFRVMNIMTVLDLLALLGAYAIGSSRERKTSVKVLALVAAVLGYFAIHLMLSSLYTRRKIQSHKQGNNGRAIVTSVSGGRTRDSS